MRAQQVVLCMYMRSTSHLYHSYCVSIRDWLEYFTYPMSVVDINLVDLPTCLGLSCQAVLGLKRQTYPPFLQKNVRESFDLLGITVFNCFWRFGDSFWSFARWGVAEWIERPLLMPEVQSSNPGHSASKNTTFLPRSLKAPQRAGRTPGSLNWV